jgi:hypothetical protein
MDVSISTGAHEYPILTTELRKMVKELVHRKSREWLQTEEEAEYPGAKPKSPQLAHSTRLLRAMRYILPKRPFLAHLKAAPEPPPSNAPLNECIPSSLGRHRIEKVQRAGTSVQLVKGRLQKQMYRPRVRRVEQNVVLPPSLVAASSQVEDGSAKTGPRTNSFERNTAERPDSVPGFREAHDAPVPRGRDA